MGLLDDNESGDESGDDEWQRLLGSAPKAVETGSTSSSLHQSLKTSAFAPSPTADSDTGPDSAPAPVLSSLRPWRKLLDFGWNKPSENKPSEQSPPNGSTSSILKSLPTSSFASSPVVDVDDTGNSAEDAAEPVDKEIVLAAAVDPGDAEAADKAEPAEPASEPKPPRRVPSSGRLTAVKSMPFRPAKLLPTDIIVSSAGKRQFLSGPDLETAGPPPKLLRVASEDKKSTSSGVGDHLSETGDAVDNESPAPLHEDKEPPLALTDNQGRVCDMEQVIVNFSSVGATYARTLHGGRVKGDICFDWEGVRQCVRFLRDKLGLRVTGVVSEALHGPDMGSKASFSLPFDIRMMCQDVKDAEDDTSSLGSDPRRAASLMVAQLAHKTNCRFISDNTGDLLQRLCAEDCRTWLRSCRRLLLIRYFFNRESGMFETPDVPASSGPRG